MGGRARGYSLNSRPFLSDKQVMRAIITTLSALLALGASARAQTPLRDPGESLLPGSRVLRRFDFEELKLGNYEAVPMYWSKVAGRGFPAYSDGAFDRGPHAVVRSRDTAFKLETNGGSVAYRLTPPPDKRIPIHSEADYYILAFARTQNLKHARADVAAWFADDDGNLLPGSERHSQPYIPANADSHDAWRVLYIHVPGPTDPAAKSLILQLGLLQPQQLGAPDSASGLGRFQIYQQDIEGAVWFDDIVVFQLPRVSVRVPSAAIGNIFAAGQRPELDLVVSDLGDGGTGGAGPGGGGGGGGGVAATHKGALDVRLTIANADGLVFASQRFAAAPAADRAWTHRYTHAAPLPAGLYAATLEIMSPASSTLIARRQAQFLSLPAAPNLQRPAQPAPEFGLGFDTQAHRNNGAHLDQVPTLVRHAGVGLVQLPAWRREMSEDALTRRDASLDSLLTALQRLDVRTIGTFSAIPATLARRLPARPGALKGAFPGADRDSLLALLHADAALWRPYLSFPLTRYANRIDLWQLGAPDNPFSSIDGAQGPDATDQYARLYERASAELSSLLNRRQLIIPWNALYDFDARQFPSALLDLRLPAIIKPAQIPAYIDNFRQALTPRPATSAPATPAAPLPPPSLLPLFAHLDPLDEGSVPHAQRLADFAQRIIMARIAQPRAILFDVRPGSPDELFLVYRTLVRAIGNATFIAELPLGRGLRAFLFDRQGSGTLILWNDGGTAPEIPLDLPLGATPRLTDLVGNPQPLALDPATGLTRLLVTATPLILDQLDPRPLQLQTSFALAMPTLPAGAGSLRTEVLLANPFAENLSGTLRFLPPRGWAADPPSLRLSLPPGKTLRQSVTIRYPFTENSGRKELNARLSLEQSASLNAQEMALSFPVTVTSDRVELEGFTQMLDNGDLVVQQMVTNISDRPLDAQAYVLLPGYPRQQRYVSGLAAGQTAIKRFHFPATSYVGANGDIATALKGQSATLGLRQNDGKTLLTRTLPLE